MKTLHLMVFLLNAILTNAQSNKDSMLVAQVGKNYIESFYQGDTLKINASLRPTLTKFGYYKNKQTGKFESDDYITYRDAIIYAETVKAGKKFPKPNAPQVVRVLDILYHIAAAKITVWWGKDCLLLSREDDN